MEINLKEIINSDLFRLGGNTSKKSLFINILLNPEFRFMYIHRKCNYYRDKNKFKYMFYRVKLYRLNLRYGFEISNKATIGKGFKIDHRGSIIINPNAILGKNVNDSFIIPGLPNTIELDGTLKLINVPGAIITLFPILTLPTILELAPIQTLSPIIGAPLFFPLFCCPIKTPEVTLIFFPK